jgi:hypothetical protein
VLAAHLPSPAVIVDRHADLISANDGFWALTDGVADDLPDAPGFAVPLRLRCPAGELQLLTTLTHFGTAVDVTVAELRMEAFLPGDEATALAVAALAH